MKFGRKIRTIASLGLAGLLSLSPGCMTTRPIYDTEGNYLGKKTELDKEKTEDFFVWGVTGLLINANFGPVGTRLERVAGSALNNVARGALNKNDGKPIIVQKPTSRPSNPIDLVVTSEYLLLGDKPMVIAFAAKYPESWATNPDYLNKTQFAWTLNDKPLDCRLNGQTTIKTAGDYNLGLKIATPDGQEYSFSKTIRARVLPKN